jgi:hypothetical protein
MMNYISHQINVDDKICPVMNHVLNKDFNAVSCQVESKIMLRLVDKIMSIRGQIIDELLKTLNNS